MTPDELAARIKDWGEYDAVRVLPDGSIAALGRLMFTHAVHLGCDPCGWARRFCFEDPAKAREQFEQLQTEDDELVGWVARRPEHGPR